MNALKATFWQLPLLVVAMLPFAFDNSYYFHVASLIGVYWILIVGLNLVVGYMGQLSVGHVGLFAIGAYTVAIASGKFGWPVELALGAASILGAFCGFLLGIPSLRLPGFYFAMTTLGVSVIVGEVLVAQSALTGGGAGLPVPSLTGFWGTSSGFYLVTLGVGTVITVLAWNVARMMWGMALIALRDSSVAAASVGVSRIRIKLTIFAFSGFTAGLAGGLFGILQSYITPETFQFDLGLFFFICIIVGGKGSMLGPFIGTMLLTLLPEVSASFSQAGHFLYALVLLSVVLLVPEGVVSLLVKFRERPGRKQPAINTESLDLTLLEAVLKENKVA